MRSVSFDSAPVKAGGGGGSGTLFKLGATPLIAFNSRRRRQDMRCKFAMSEASGSAPYAILRVKESSTRPVADDNSGDKHSSTTPRNVSRRRDGADPERNVIGKIGSRRGKCETLLFYPRTSAIVDRNRKGGESAQHGIRRRPVWNKQQVHL
ncbi:hypothetical protein EDB92DRAFT_1903820 [Lactarius akahatsu]|uniref:Uncharacterized protein n=1 Tax=Lactarius akahatsu TaxID=416441 RepID=A0AAD4Q815_9AGAM|nr:hypothetical protein EDB92DRAFT_1903820 [Lactarius akahatsu]